MRRLFLLLFFAYLAVITPIESNYLHAREIEVSLREYWTTFRKTEPFLVQDVVVSKIDSNKRVHILLTEPPSAAFRNRDQWLKDIFGDHLVRAEVFRHKIGFDGWVNDIGVTLKDVDEIAISRFVSAVHTEFHKTDYKASWREYSPKPWDQARFMTRRKGSPNLNISAQSLIAWLFEKEITFSFESINPAIPSVTGATYTTLNEAGAPGVFYSDTPGLVLWIINREKPLNDRLADLRRFVVDTDAILGAVAADDRLLTIIGRERTVSRTELEPLRIETILTLASSRQEDLAQSYERNAPLAGQVIDPELAAAIFSQEKLFDVFDNGGKNALISRGEVELFFALFELTSELAPDWAPIFLSRELTNTEYGNLLNITDQMLKGWSMGNRVEYVRFPYPKPRTNPDAEGVFERLENRAKQQFNSLTFNWNTAGFGVWTKFRQFEIFSVLNSGALPISYIPEVPGLNIDERLENEIQLAEDEYWKFFAQLSDPYLLRVAQYASLHIIFTRYPVAAERVEPLIAKTAYISRSDGMVTAVQAAITQMYETATRLRAGEDVSKIGGLSAAKRSSCFAATDDFDLSVLSASRPIGKRLLDTGGDPTKLRNIALNIVDPRNNKTNLLKQYDNNIVNYNNILNENDRELPKFRAAFEAFIKKTSTDINLIQMKCDAEAFQCKLKYNLDEFSFTQCDDISAECRVFIKLSNDGKRLLPKLKALEKIHERISRLGDQVERQRSIFNAISKNVVWFGDCGAAWRGLVASRPELKDGVHNTPSIVLSDDAGAITAVGGHNLAGRSARVIDDSNVKKGKFEVDPDTGIIRLNPADMSKSHDIARVFERDWRRYQGGSDAFQARVHQRMSEKLATDARPPQAFTDVTLGRKAQIASSVRGGATAAGRRRSTVRPVRLTADQVTPLRDFAKEHLAHLVIRRTEGGLEIAYPGGRPPIVLRSQSQIEFQRGVEDMADRVARDIGGEANAVTFVSNGRDMTAGDLASIRFTAEARAGAGGGGIKGPPSDPGLSAFAERPRGNNTFGMIFGRGGRRASLFFARKAGSSAKMLSRQDLYWKGTKLESSATRNATETSGTVIVKMHVPLLKSAKLEPGVEFGMNMRLEAFFRRRQPTEQDAALIVKRIEDELAVVGDPTPPKAVLPRLHEALENDLLDASVKVRTRIRDANSDIFVVEKDERSHRNHRG